MRPRPASRRRRGETARARPRRHAADARWCRRSYVGFLKLASTEGTPLFYPRGSGTLLRLDARRLDDAAPERDVALDLLPHLLGRGRRGHVANFGEPLLHVGQHEGGTDLLIDAIDDWARR